jgi:hypothetical protein
MDVYDQVKCILSIKEVLLKADERLLDSSFRWNGTRGRTAPGLPEGQAFYEGGAEIATLNSSFPEEMGRNPWRSQ